MGDDCCDPQNDLHRRLPATSRKAKSRAANRQAKQVGDVENVGGVKWGKLMPCGVGEHARL